MQTTYTVEITDFNAQGLTSWWQSGEANAQKIHCRSIFPCAALLSHRNGACSCCGLRTQWFLQYSCPLGSAIFHAMCIKLHDVILCHLMLSYRFAGSSMGYFVPLAPNLTRHFHGMLRKAPPGQSPPKDAALIDPKEKAGIHHPSIPCSALWSVPSRCCR